MESSNGQLSWICENCGFQIAFDSCFCGSCGRPQIKESLIRSRSTADYDPYSPLLKPWRIERSLDTQPIKKNVNKLRSDSEREKPWHPVMKNTNPKVNLRQKKCITSQKVSECVSANERTTTGETATNLFKSFKEDALVEGSDKTLNSSLNVTPSSSGDTRPSGQTSRSYTYNHVLAVYPTPLHSLFARSIKPTIQICLHERGIYTPSNFKIYKRYIDINLLQQMEDDPSAKISPNEIFPIKIKDDHLIGQESDEETQREREGEHTERKIENDGEFSRTNVFEGMEREIEPEKRRSAHETEYTQPEVVNTVSGSHRREETEGKIDVIEPDTTQLSTEQTTSQHQLDRCTDEEKVIINEGVSDGQTDNNTTETSKAEQEIGLIRLPNGLARMMLPITHDWVDLDAIDISSDYTMNRVRADMSLLSFRVKHITDSEFRCALQRQFSIVQLHNSMKNSLEISKAMSVVKQYVSVRSAGYPLLSDFTDIISKLLGTNDSDITNELSINSLLHPAVLKIRNKYLNRVYFDDTVVRLVVRIPFSLVNQESTVKEDKAEREKVEEEDCDVIVSSSDIEPQSLHILSMVSMSVGLSAVAVKGSTPPPCAPASGEHGEDSSHSTHTHTHHHHHHHHHHSNHAQEKREMRDESGEGMRRPRTGRPPVMHSDDISFVSLSVQPLYSEYGATPKVVVFTSEALLMLLGEKFSLGEYWMEENPRQALRALGKEICSLLLYVETSNDTAVSSCAAESVTASQSSPEMSKISCRHLRVVVVGAKDKERPNSKAFE